MEVQKELKEIRQLSLTYPRVQALTSRITEASLKAAHKAQEKNKAAGIDNVTKAEYGTKLDGNIKQLHERMRKFYYWPKPVRRTYIPKTDGKLRPLGIPAYEDRLVQSVMSDILVELYETRFLEESYGYRPNKSAHDTIRVINQTIMTKRVNYVLEADIKGFFDNLSHEWLLKFLEHDIADSKFMKLIARFLKAGVMDKTLIPSTKGSPQGGLISPVLSNVYLHYVLDLWVAKLKQTCKGEVYYVRYADDFILMFQYENEAQKTLEQLRERLNKFSLELAEEKTRILAMGRYKGTGTTFDFLGFTFYDTQTRTGKYRLGLITSKKKLKAKRQEIKKELRGRRHRPVPETLEYVSKVLTGHVNYYGVNGNEAIYKFHAYVKETLFRSLNRRHQKRSMTHEVYNRIWESNTPRPKVAKDIWNWKPKLI